MTRTYGMTWLAPLLVAGALALTGPAAAAAEGAQPEAAESEDRPPAPEVPAEPAADQGAADEATGPRTGTSGGVEVFIPSEEISEDFAVSFPVDI